MPLVTNRKLEVDTSTPTKKSPPKANSPSIEEIKSAGKAKLRTAREMERAEEQGVRNAPKLWHSAFDFVFDSSTDPTTCGGYVTGGRGVLVIIPGFSSWQGMKPAHVERWKEAALLVPPTESVTGARSAEQKALSLVFKWPCGEVKWTSMEANVEGAAAWADAHDAAKDAAASLTRLLRYLSGLGGKVVVAAHSLGALVALQALSNDLAAPRVDGLLVLGAAVNSHALSGIDEQGVPAEFPFARLMSKVDSLVLAHSAADTALRMCWAPFEKARLRLPEAPPPPLGLVGPVLEARDVSHLGEWADRVIMLNAAVDATTHDPCDYLTLPGVAYRLRQALFPGAPPPSGMLGPE